MISIEQIPVLALQHNTVTTTAKYDKCPEKNQAWIQVGLLPLLNSTETQAVQNLYVGPSSVQTKRENKEKKLQDMASSELTLTNAFVSKQPI